MNVFDIGIILILIMSFIIGFKNGVIKETVALVGIILVFIVSYLLKDYLGSLLCYIFPFFKFSGKVEGITSLNIIMYQAIAFIIIFSILLGVYAIVLKISKKIQKLVNLTIILWLPSKLLGGVVSFIKGYIVLFAVLIVCLIPLKNQNIFTKSKLVNTILYHTPILSNSTSKFTGATEEIYQLGEKVMNDMITKKEANDQAIQIILKYNIASESTINKLIEMGKIDS